MGEEEKKKSRSRSKSKERPSGSSRSRSKSRERKPTSDDEGSVDDMDKREVRRGRKKGESGGDKEGGSKKSSRDKSTERGSRRGRSVERTKSSDPIVTLDKNGFPVTLDTKETAERRRKNRSSSRDGPTRRRSISRDGPRDGRDLTDEDLSAIKRRSRSSSRERGIGRSKSGSEKDKSTKLSSRGRKKPGDLSVSSSHSRGNKIMETSRTNSFKGNNTLEKLLSLPKDDAGGAGGSSVAESRGTKTSASSRSFKKKGRGNEDDNMSVMSFEPINEWGDGTKGRKKIVRKKPASKMSLVHE